MDLKDKKKVVKVIDAAEIVLERIECSQKRSEKQLYRSTSTALNNLQNNPFIGQGVQKRKIPPSLRHLPNLFRIELAHYWRLLYYVVGDETTIICVVFEIVDHKQYDKIFGYK
ncbi:MAG: hypothetical protein OXR66_06225 [Candidatus Woesearchaeota archaeon]|nr:hypothetical protein [Candidatus Woesearchaeota archaeon]